MIKWCVLWDSMIDASLFWGVLNLLAFILNAVPAIKHHHPISILLTLVMLYQVINWWYTVYISYKKYSRIY